MAYDIGPVLLCDGSQSGLLTALFYAEAMRPRASEILMEPPLQPSLFGEPEHISTETDKARRVLRAIRTKLPGEAYWVFQSVHASNREDRGTLILRYLRTGWRVGKKLNDHIADPNVWETVKVSRQVGFEIHRLTGLARFRPIQGVYYCRLAPDHDVVPFLAPHFADRLSDQNWILHDEKRAIAAVFDKNQQEWALLPLEAGAWDGLPIDPFTQLWQVYHKTISIQARENPALQRQHMPRRYWKYLFEMQTNNQG